MKKIILPILAFFCANLAFSQIAQETGSAQYPYKPSGFSGKPKAEEFANAIKAAKLNALSRYIANLDQNSRLNYAKIQSSIEADIGRIAPNASILRNEYDKRQKLIFITLRAGIDTSLLRDRLIMSGGAAQVPSAEKKPICGIFVARRQTSVTAFDEKRVQANRDEVANDEFQEVASNGLSTSLTSDQRRERISTTAGSRTQKADEISYAIISARSLDSTVSGILSTAGYKLAPARFLGKPTNYKINLDEINQDFSVSSDLRQETTDNIVEGLAMIKIPYLATGTLNLEAPTRHPVTGETKVTVKVIITVEKLVKSEFGEFFVPENVGQGTKQISALGSSQTTAEENAIDLAAKAAAQLVVAALQKNSVR